MVGDHRASHDRLARPGWRDEHPEIVVDEISDRGFLLSPKNSPELEVHSGRFRAVVENGDGAAEGFEQMSDLVGEPSGEVEPFEVLAVLMNRGVSQVENRMRCLS